MTIMSKENGDIVRPNVLVGYVLMVPVINGRIEILIPTFSSIMYPTGITSRYFALYGKFYWFGAYQVLCWNF